MARHPVIWWAVQRLSVSVEHVEDFVELGLALEAVVLEHHNFVHDAVQVVDALVFLFFFVVFPVFVAFVAFL